MHTAVIKKSGGLQGVKNRGQLESVLEHIQNDIYYPNFIDKITHLVHSIIKNHSLNDGNKRTALSASTLFINANNTSQEFSLYGIDWYIGAVEEIVVLVANNTLEKRDLKQVLIFLLDIDALEKELGFQQAGDEYMHFRFFLAMYKLMQE